MEEKTEDKQQMVTETSNVFKRQTGVVFHV